MDETNQTNAAANRATGPNPAPVPSATPVVDGAAVERAAATISEHIVRPAPKVSATPVLPVPQTATKITPVPPQPVPSVSAPPVPPPVTPKPSVQAIQFKDPPVPPPATVPVVLSPPIKPSAPPAMPVSPKPIPPPPPPVRDAVPPTPPKPPVPPIQFSVPRPTINVSPVPPPPPDQTPPPPAPPASPKPAQVVPPPPILNISTGEDLAPVTSVDPIVKVEPVPPTKPLRQDIASIIGKIRLPERLTVKMSGEKTKTAIPPPVPPIPPVPEKEQAKTEVSTQASETPSQKTPQNDGSTKEEATSRTMASVHTLKDDLQNVVRDKKMSLVRAVALESEKKKGQENVTGIHLPADKVRSQKFLVITFLLIICLVLAAVTYWGVTSVLRHGNTNTQSTTAPSLIFTEGTFSFPQGTRSTMDFKRAMSTQARNVTNVPLGTVLHIIPTKSETGADGTVTEIDDNIGDFLNAIGTQATQGLIRAFRGDFFLGFHQTATKLAPIIIIPVTSYERAFAGMLAWEPAINGDLAPIFTPVPPQTTDEKGLFVDRQFQDTLINNYDVRVLRDDSGTIQLMYSFPTRNMLIIAESPYSFTEALSRLRASRQL
jgi:hypothetical protein